MSYQGQYATDVLAEKAYELLDEGVHSNKPFFLTVAPVAPHSNVDSNTFRDPNREGDQLDEVHMTAPIPAERHRHLFPGVKVPRTANFNPDKVCPLCPSFIHKMLIDLARWCLLDQSPR